MRIRYYLFVQIVVCIYFLMGRSSGFSEWRNAMLLGSVVIVTRAILGFWFLFFEWGKTL